jgi:hypothetical protein
MAHGASMEYPRDLRPGERSLLHFVLPQEAPGYQKYRDLVEAMKVIGEGRRGRGNIILGRPGDIPDLTSPLPPVVAYGAVEMEQDTLSITVREVVGDQMDIEIVSSQEEEVTYQVTGGKRWTYSTWQPGSVSPSAQLPVREVVIEHGVVLAISREEGRLWVFDAQSGMNILIPITNFYNELMLHKGIRDPKVALSSGRLFSHLDEYPDEDLRAAFLAYNKVRRKVDIQSKEETPVQRGLLTSLKVLFQKRQ